MIGKSYLNKAVERGRERERHPKSRMWKGMEFAVKEKKKSKMLACENSGVLGTVIGAGRRGGGKSLQIESLGRICLGEEKKKEIPEPGGTERKAISLGAPCA